MKFTTDVFHDLHFSIRVNFFNVLPQLFERAQDEKLFWSNTVNNVRQTANQFGKFYLTYTYWANLVSAI